MMNEAVHIIGAGPVGMILALQIAQIQPVKLYVLLGRAALKNNHTNSIEVIPAPLLALLLDFGLHPHSLGVDILHTHRYTAWDSDVPSCTESAYTAYIERPQLELMLMGCVQAQPAICVIPITRADLARLIQDLKGVVYDATGRSAFTARIRHCLQSGPVARTWIQAYTLPKEERSFRIAALPDGYVYRVATARSVLIGLCGSSSLLRLTPARWSDYLEQFGAAWLDLPMLPIENWQTAKAGPAAIQWAEPQQGHLLVGDAAFSRDTLASQGLALGISDALYASVAVTDEQIKLWQENRKTQFLKHLTHLAEEISQCRFRESPFWSTYFHTVETVQNLYQGAAALRVSALRYGMITPNL
jgi:flavin-dependent dehydrogenase